MDNKREISVLTEDIFKRLLLLTAFVIKRAKFKMILN